MNSLLDRIMGAGLKSYINTEAFEKGKNGEPPYLVGDEGSEAREIADKAYAAGQAASLIQSAKKISEK
jgi:hypothetical protein